ncbi:hypothetical protein Gotur_031192 [Gossypium turneri]
MRKRSHTESSPKTILR